MSRLNPEPRVNFKTLGAHPGVDVRLTTKVIKHLTENTISAETSDGHQITVQLPIGKAVNSTYVEFIGKVSKDNKDSFRALTAIDLGDSLDMKAVNGVVEFSNSPKGQGVFF